MILTYKELYEKFAFSENAVDENIFEVTEQLFVKTPTGHSKIQIVFKKQGHGVAVTLENGIVVQGEKRHAIMSSIGLVYLQDAKDIQHKDGFVKVIDVAATADTEFYDIGIAAPHLYIGLDGCVHHNTYTIMKTIKDAGMTQGKDYVKLSGRATPISIYQTLFMYRDGGLVVFDDLDSMWSNTDATNILKAALDTSPVREISWVSNNTINVSKMSDEKRKALFSDIDDQLNAEFAEYEDEDEEDQEAEEDNMLGYEGDKQKKLPKRTGKIKFPSTFDFTGRVIFISNLKREEFDSAIMSRSAKINMDLSPEEILKRMRAILPNLGGDDVSLEDKEELLDELMKMHGRKELDAITMRDFVKGMNILRSGANNWRDLLRYA